MRFHVEFTYSSSSRDKVLRLLRDRGLNPGNNLKILQAYVAIATGTGYVIVDTNKAAALYEACSAWSDIGQLKVTPVIEVDEI